MTSGVALESEQVSSYRTTGFLVLPDVFSAQEVSALVDECDRLERSDIVDPHNLRTHVLGSQRPPDRLDPVIDVSPVLARAATDVRLLAIAGQLLGDEARLFKDKVIFKPPGMQGYKSHQDYAYWHWLPAAPDALLSVLVALDSATVANGAVEFFPGFHDRLLTPAGVAADVDDEQLGGSGVVVETSPGDVVAFHSLTPHRSGDNHSSSMRRQLYLSFNAARTGDLYARYYQHLHESVLAGMPAADRERAYFR